MKVTVVGGGISGLVTALSLHAAGLHPLVRESAREMRAVGVGINLLPHAVRELTELGLGDELARIALAPHELLYCDRRGNRVWSEPLGLAAGYLWPQYSVHRGKLQMMLLDAVHRRLGEGAVRTGMSFERFEDRGESVLVHFTDRATGAQTLEETDLLIGADGIDSRVRAQLRPGEGPSHWNGVHMWRGLSDYPHILGGRSIVVAGGLPGAKFVAYPIGDPPDGGRNALVNWVLEIRREGPDGGLDRSNRPVATGEALERLTDWNLPWIDLRELVGASTAIFEYPMLDRDPLPRWSQGRVTLLGDAAHPMFPMGMNGGSQSVVDARVLAWCLATHDDEVSALRHYDHLRREPLNRIVLANRDLGPEKIIAMAEADAPGGGLPRPEADAVARGYKQLAGCTPDHVNAGRSWSTPVAGP